MAERDCRDWHAVHDFMPGTPPTLRVTGTCTLPAGSRCELRKHEPQGINDEDLLLDLVVHPPEGGGDGEPTDVQCSYREDTDVAYRTVSLTDGPFEIPVERVS